MVPSQRTTGYLFPLPERAPLATPSLFVAQVERREHFRLAKAAQFVDRRLQQDLSRARRLVESLDEQDGRPRSIMWPEEDDDTLENAVSELPGGRLAESWETGKGDRTIASTTLAVVVSSGSGGDLGSETEGEGLGPGGGLREEWDMMTPEEKVWWRIQVQ